MNYRAFDILSVLPLLQHWAPISMTDDPSLHSSSLLMTLIVNCLHGHVIGGCQRTAMLSHRRGCEMRWSVGSTFRSSWNIRRTSYLSNHIRYQTTAMIAQAFDRYGTSFLYLIQSSPYLRWFNQCQIANIDVGDRCAKQSTKRGPWRGHHWEQHMSIGRDRHVKGHPSSEVSCLSSCRFRPHEDCRC